MGMVKLIESHDEGDLCLIKSLLEGNNIEFFVQNDHFGSLYPGASMSFNARVVMISDHELGRAQTLLSRLDEFPTWDKAS